MYALLRCPWQVTPEGRGGGWNVGVLHCLLRGKGGGGEPWRWTRKQILELPTGCRTCGDAKMGIAGGRSRNQARSLWAAEAGLQATWAILLVCQASTEGGGGERGLILPKSGPGPVRLNVHLLMESLCKALVTSAPLTQNLPGLPRPNNSDSPV